MLPKLILNESYNFDEDYIYKNLEEYCMNGSNCSRIAGIRYGVNNGEKTIIAWQCNMADVQNFDIKLPTIIRIQVDINNIVKSIDLNDCFKGSQGISCSVKYLQRRLKEVVTGTEFSVKNPVIKDPFILCCRHVYELVHGSCSFVNWCENQNIQNAFLTESTQVFEKDKYIEAYDRISINGSEVTTKISFQNFKDEIKYNKFGAVESVYNMRITGYLYNGIYFEQVGDIKNLCAESSNDFKMKLMKIISKYWIESGKRLNVNRDFHFSQIWPPTFFGIISQVFALCIFGKNYAYFQHCISGIQRIEDKPYCIGIIKNIDEGKIFFKGFSEDDLY